MSEYVPIIRRIHLLTIYSLTQSSIYHNLMSGPRASTFSTLQDMSYDIIRMLSRLLEGADTAHLLSTCRKLHGLMYDDAVWQEHCSRYGVTDQALFSDATFFEVYSEVLHTYGPLLGLWASDHPYRGNVIEFRFDPDVRGIICEAWTLWKPDSDTANADMSIPRLPAYFMLMAITLPPSSKPRRAQLTWYTHHDGTKYVGQTGDRCPVPTLGVLPETYESLHIGHTFGNSYLPDFPRQGFDAWYDNSRRLPRLQMGPKLVSSEFNLGRRSIDYFIYMQRTPGDVKPKAVIVYPAVRGQREVFAMLEDPIAVVDTSLLNINGKLKGPSFHRRFYPLHLPVAPGNNPSDPYWRPSTLDGIWLGAYGPHGTEVVYIHFDERTSHVQAIKITGDFNVPRGAVTWDFPVEHRLRPGDVDYNHVWRFGNSLSGFHIYRGVGVTSSAGYMCVNCITLGFLFPDLMIFIIYLLI